MNFIIFLLHILYVFLFPEAVVKDRRHMHLNGNRPHAVTDLEPPSPVRPKVTI
jgi:hypothetical protein